MIYLGNIIHLVESLPKILTIIMVFSIPLSAVWGIYRYKMQQLKLKSNTASPTPTLDGTDLRLLKETLAQNKQLEERVKNLETIVTSLDKDLLSVNTNDTAHVKEMATKLER